MMEEFSPLLWVDTTQSNCDRYVERYFMPTLSALPEGWWKWRQQKKELTIGNALCDFRSAEKPQNIEGFGYKFVFINEAGIVLKNPYIWYNAVRPMLMDYKANGIIGGTPKGKRVKSDEALFFTLFKKAKQDRTTWTDFQFTSYDNPFLDPFEIDELVSEVSPAIRRQEIGGEFIDDVEAEIIKRAWWKYYRDLPLERPIRKIQSWDTAFKKSDENSYSVCTTWNQYKTGFYLINCWRARVEFPELKRQVVFMYNKYKPDVIVIEDKASGISVIQELQRETSLPIKPFKMDSDKIARVHAVTPTIEAGNCSLPENAPWVNDYINECADFPAAEFNDQVDSTSQALLYMKGGGSPIPTARSRRAKHSQEIMETY